MYVGVVFVHGTFILGRSINELSEVFELKKLGKA